VYKLDRKRAVITGAASGLGRSLATTLAQEGWKMGIVDIDDSGAKETLRMVERAGGTGEVFHADVSKPEEVRAFADHFFESWGGVDLLVNNAGVICLGLVGDITLADWNWIVGINFWGMLYGCHEFVPRMKAQGGGHIVNVASGAGLIPIPEGSPYNVTKAAVVSLSETLSYEAARHNIDVTTACPMFFKTSLHEKMRVTDEWERKWALSTFERGGMSSDKVAGKIITAVKKNKPFAFPQPTGMILWLPRRFTPQTNARIYRLLGRYGLLRPLASALSRLRMIQ
jgi:NAD(P)-dependent dehydrogenase (short-subunit alcohol dehydrogenase family)